MNVDRFKEMIDSIKTAQKSIPAVFQDESIPLADRWEMFKLNDQEDAYVSVQGWYMDFDVLDDDFLASRDLSRHETVSLVSLVEWCTDVYCGPDDKYLLSEDDLNKLKSEILLSGYTAFVFDW